MTAAWARAFTAAETRTRTSPAASTWWALSRRPSHSTAKMKAAARFAPRISPLFARKLRQASNAPNAITGRITTSTVDRTPADCFRSEDEGCRPVRSADISSVRPKITPGEQCAQCDHGKDHYIDG